jgi:RNA polymerase primary sigma factor
MVTATLSETRCDVTSTASSTKRSPRFHDSSLPGQLRQPMDRFGESPRDAKPESRVWSALREDALSSDPESVRLSAEQETRLFQRMIDSRRRAESLRKLLIGERANPQIREAIQRHGRAVTELRNYLVRVFSKLAASVASRYVSHEFRLDELLSEAHITLLRAVELFDPDRGYRFSTYATNAIRHNLHRYINNQHKARTMASPAVEPESLADETEGCPRRREQEYRVRMDRISHWIRQLDTREQTILESRYGLSHDSHTTTLQCLADQLGVSRERIRQLERRAIAKLQGMAKDEWCEFDA